MRRYRVCTLWSAYGVIRIAFESGITLNPITAFLYLDKGMASSAQWILRVSAPSLLTLEPEKRALSVGAPNVKRGRANDPNLMLRAGVKAARPKLKKVRTSSQTR